ncbi:hypothetical protein TPA0910_25370 [Streptomyces hygroscopicus subsp. sporocinereus]|uniref:Uncharacterized protein n=1 Tax=Streptomyces hygroscopicus TaxID=1912 RepID=A0ABQ3TXQ5_STRHY|nr:hypothetical protein TPA0910_25370 [Streptomyces hygroscopicus]
MVPPGGGERPAPDGGESSEGAALTYGAERWLPRVLAAVVRVAGRLAAWGRGVRVRHGVAVIRVLTDDDML